MSPPFIKKGLFFSAVHQLKPEEISFILYAVIDFYLMMDRVLKYFAFVYKKN